MQAFAQLRCLCESVLPRRLASDTTIVVVAAKITAAPFNAGIEWFAALSDDRGEAQLGGGAIADARASRVKL